MIRVLAQMGSVFADVADQEVANRHPRVRRLRLITDHNDVVILTLRPKRLGGNHPGGAITDNDMPHRWVRG